MRERTLAMTFVILLAGCGAPSGTEANSEEGADAAADSRTGNAYTDNLAEQLDAAEQTAGALEAAAERQAEEAERLRKEASGNP